MFDYEPITTFWADFSIADRFGTKAVKDTYKRAFTDWKSDYKFLTELVLVTNHKIWEHWEQWQGTGDRTEYKLAETYDALWKKAASYAINNLKDEELRYYLRVTD